MSYNPIVSIKLCFSEHSDHFSILIKRYGDKIHLKLAEYVITPTKFRELMKSNFDFGFETLSSEFLSTYLCNIDGFYEFVEKPLITSISIFGKKTFCEIRFYLSSSQIGGITRRINKINRLERCVYNV